jgi:hypothetical protein
MLFLASQVISADKGFSSPDSFRGVGDPHVALHNSFSLMVNFHALRLWTAFVGGISFHTRNESSNLKVCCLVLESRPASVRAVDDVMCCYGHDGVVEDSCDCAHRRGVADSYDMLFDSRPRTVEVIDRTVSPKEFPALCEAFEEVETFGPSEFFQLHRLVSVCSSLHGDVSRWVLR